LGLLDDGGNEGGEVGGWEEERRVEEIREGRRTVRSWEPAAERIERPGRKREQIGEKDASRRRKGEGTGRTSCWESLEPSD